MIQFRASSVYQVESPLTADNRCARYRATTPNQAPVELCLLTPALRESPTWQSLVKRLKLAAMVKHPAVRAVTDLALDQDPPLVVLEWLSASNLALAASLQPRSRTAILQLVRHLSDGLAAAHRLGIIHGGINPHTIVPRDDGSWVLDVSSLSASLPSATTDAHSFLPPEAGPNQEAELADDVFGLAAVFQWLWVSAGFSRTDLSSQLSQLLEESLSPDPFVRPTAGQFSWRMRTIAELERLPPRELEFAQTQILTAHEVPAERVAPTSATTPLTRLGRFELLEKIGEGGMGTVYRARDISDGATVAVKVLHARIADGENSRRRFAKEARLLARANNPFLANLLEFNEDGGVNYLAVEFVAGGPVGRFLQQAGRFTEALSLAIIADVARGLAIAHERGIVHRDLKPDNLLLTIAGAEILTTSLRSATDSSPQESPDRLDDEPIVKLSDFGLARTADQSESLAITSDGTLLGTPLYMSPEQCRGTPVDARSDIYSLGATFFHFLSGRPTFDGDSPLAVIQKHCHEPPPSLRQLRPEISEATTRVIEKCLAKNPDARYADASELLIDVERLLHGEPTSLRLHPPTPDTRGREVMRISFACELTSSPAQLWPYVSHTDRVNHSLGLPAVQYSTRVDPQRGVERFGEMKVAGQRLRWQEHPYEWVEGRRMSVLREFLLGPLTWFINTVELVPLPGGGTRVVQTFQVSPRNWLGRWLAKWELGRKSPRSFRRAYEHIDQYLSQDTRRDPTADAFGRGGVLSAHRKSQLQERLERLRVQRVEPRIVEMLGQYLEHASDLDVARIRPLAFAERFQLDPRQVVTACLLGAREGLLILQWDILCPSCRIPADVQETLAALQDHSYCPACDLKYEVDFANSVEMIFRAHPELRGVDTQTYCIGGPAFSPHVVAQLRLAPGERFLLELSLEEGVYRLRGPQLPFSVEARVSPRGSVSRWELPLLRPPSRGTIPVLRSGSQVITLVNNTNRELLLRIERTAGRSLAFTAADASSLALFREMFPEQVLAPGQIVSVTTVTFLLVQLAHADLLYEQLGEGPAFGRIRRELSQLEEVIRSHDGAVVKTIGEGLLATFVEPLAAARAALDMLRSQATDRLPLQLILHRGPAMVTTVNGRLDYFGANPHLARQLLEAAEANEVLATEAVANQAEVAQLMRDNEIIADLLPTAANHVQQLIHRWRIPVGHVSNVPENRRAR